MDADFSSKDRNEEEIKNGLWKNKTLVQLLTKGEKVSMRDQIILDVKQTVLLVMKGYFNSK